MSPFPAMGSELLPGMAWSLPGTRLGAFRWSDQRLGAFETTPPTSPSKETERQRALAGRDHLAANGGGDEPRPGAGWHRDEVFRCTFAPYMFTETQAAGYSPGKIRPLGPSWGEPFPPFLFALCARHRLILLGMAGEWVTIGPICHSAAHDKTMRSIYERAKRRPDAAPEPPIHI